MTGNLLSVIVFLGLCYISISFHTHKLHRISRLNLNEGRRGKNVEKTEDIKEAGVVLEPEKMKDLYQQWENEALTDPELQSKPLIDIHEEDNGGKVINTLPSDVIPLPASKLPIVAVIGRPNTGKSTIVNKVSDTYSGGAIVHDEAGITRDRTYRTAMWNSYNFQVVDTGGIVFDDTSDIFSEKITQQALLALGEAAVALMVVDGKEGITQLDIVLADWLRKNNKIPTYVTVNKCESETQGIMNIIFFYVIQSIYIYIHIFIHV